MAKKIESVMVANMKYCLVCHSPKVEVHHVYFGSANRQISDRMGFIVPLCYEHHRGNSGVHFNRDFDLKLKRMGQEIYENKFGSREDFIRLFGRSYL